MHRRLLPKAALVAPALWLAPRAVHAGKYDLDLTRLGAQQGTALTQDNAGFRSLSSELGTVMAPRPVDPADSLGLSGFAISSDFGVSTISANRDYWSRASGGKATDVAPTLQIMARKGLWPGIEVGAGATHLFDSRMWALSGYGKIALHEGFYGRHPIPSIAVRGSFSRLLGAKDFSLTTAAPSVTVSYVFGLGKTLSLTPYIGYEALFILSRSKVLDASPSCDEFSQQGDGCDALDPSVRRELVFRDAGAIIRHRPYFGARMIFSIMRLTFEAMFTPPGSRQGKIDDTRVADGSAFQQQYMFSVGLDF